MTKDPYAPITEGDIVNVTGFPEVPMLVCTKGPHFADLIWFTADRTLQKASLPIYILVKVRSEQKVDTAKPHVNPNLSRPRLATLEELSLEEPELSREELIRCAKEIDRQDD
jgi:hypothetical protein